MRVLLFFSIIIYILSCTTNDAKEHHGFKTLTTDGQVDDIEFGKYRSSMLNLKQINKGVDSFELRIWNFGSPNELVILRCLNGAWITCNYYYQINGKNIVDSQTVLCHQINAKIAISIVNHLTKDDVLKLPSQYAIPNFKDTSIYEGGCTYFLEIATQNFYKTLLYNNPHVHTDSYHKQFLELIRFLENNFKLLRRFE